jgi:peptidylprolyl isomerase
MGTGGTVVKNTVSQSLHLLFYPNHAALELRTMNGFKHWLKISLIALLMLSLSVGLSAATKRDYGLPAGNAITDGPALLRYALPIDNKPVRDLQTNLEDIADQLRARKRWSAVTRDISQAQRIVSQKKSELLASVADQNQPQAEALMSQIQNELAVLAEVAEAQDKEQCWTKRGELLTLVGQLEELMVGDFPYEVPAEYSNLPQLKGRATVEITTTKGPVRMVVDGYSAPVTAGNFVDLVDRGFYNGLPFIRAEEFYVVQTGDPPGSEEGFIDPKTKQYRAIPLEILVRGDDQPTYGITLEQAGRYRDQPVLPFSAYGTVAMARPESDPNGASSQFFFFLFEPELTPAGLNLLDGRYTVFGYVVDGKDVLGQLKPEDKIESAKVVQGLENLVKPQTA